ncbi:MAG TPA: hypothetical protein PLD25_12950 [Chloroflexota bacterium]|nr:hypothetical protein [Chloroflexota bacterium]HUM70859.1 hypothetical protein [Chloroflexota bacterium]
MSRRVSLLMVLVTMVLLLAACGEAEPKYAAGDVLLSETFSEADAWEVFVSDDSDLQVSDGAYHIQTGPGGYIWGLNEAEHSNVEMEVTARQLSSHDNNAYGLMCRADTSNDGDGYYFLVSGDGFYSIRKGEGDDVVALIDWKESSAINEGQATNKIRAVCAGNYLGLWVNDKFVAETNDTAYTSGYAGLAAAAFDGGDADISFDDLTIKVASLTQ